MYEENTFLGKAHRLVFEYMTEYRPLFGSETIIPEDIFILWFSMSLQNWTAALGTALNPDLFFHVTYDGNLKQTTIAVYQKFDKVSVPDTYRYPIESGVSAIFPRKNSNESKNNVPKS